MMKKEKNNNKTILPLDHYDSVLDPEQLHDGRVEGMNVYEISLKNNSDLNKKT